MAAVKTDTATTLPEHPGFLSMAMTAIRLSVPWVQQPSAPCRSSEKIYTLEEVSWHDTPDDCWIVIYDRVYDITDFLYKVCTLYFDRITFLDKIIELHTNRCLKI